MATWEQLLNLQRRKSKLEQDNKPSDVNANEVRTGGERDYDRVMYSTPLRRLADKTQVFPLERNDSVRTRLTHSFEVSNLARSLGVALTFKHQLAKDVPGYNRDIPAICAAIGLIHDLGNPPFGHQGEAAIQSWFKANEKVLSCLTHEQMRKDFLKFEGNAQAFRLVTRLQLLNDDFGLDLTYATLASMMKYPTPSHMTNKVNVAEKKHGFFYSEQDIAEEVLSGCGLELGKRHPLAHLMEACDDIAYVVFDAEDAVKKGLASFSDLMAWLEHEAANKDEFILDVVRISREKNTKYREDYELSPAELNDVSMQRFRVAAISAMINEMIEVIAGNENKLISAQVGESLLENSKAKGLRDALQKFSFKHAYTHKSVLAIELNGFNVITGLMDMLWAAVVDRSDPDDPSSKRNHPFTRLVYERISENYKRAFEHPKGSAQKLHLRYRECQLVTDMIAGMTDTYAIDLYHELNSLKGELDLKSFIK